MVQWVKVGSEGWAVSGAGVGRPAGFACQWESRLHRRAEERI